MDETLAAHNERFVGTLAYLVHGTPYGKGDQPARLDTVHAIVGLYFPEMDAEYQALEEAANAYMLLMLDALIKRPETVEGRRAAHKSLTEAATLVRRTLRALQARAVEVARDLVPRRDSRMNKNQRDAVTFACILGAIMFACPPWIARNADLVPVRIYAAVYEPPPLGAIDFERLALQVLALALLALGAVFALGGRDSIPPAAPITPAAPAAPITPAAPAAPAAPASPADSPKP